MNIDEMQAGREMDALIAEKVMGLPHNELGEKCPRCGGETRIGLDRAWCGNCSEWIYSPYPEFSDDIAAAWQVVEKIRELKSAWFEIGANPDFMSDRGDYYCSIRGGKIEYDSPSCTLELYGDTAPLAICRAALKAMEAK